MSILSHGSPIAGGVGLAIAALLTLPALEWTSAQRQPSARGCRPLRRAAAI